MRILCNLDQNIHKDYGVHDFLNVILEDFEVLIKKSELGFTVGSTV